MNEWTRIPEPIENDADRRSLVAILAAADLEVRIVKHRDNPKGKFQRYIEYRQQV